MGCKSAVAEGGGAHVLRSTHSLMALRVMFLCFYCVAIRVPLTFHIGHHEIDGERDRLLLERVTFVPIVHVHRRGAGAGDVLQRCKHHRLRGIELAPVLVSMFSKVTMALLLRRARSGTQRQGSPAEYVSLVHTSPG